MGKLFEQKLSDLSMAMIQEKIPFVSKYMIGFEEVKTNDEETKSVGNVILKVGNHYYYIPIIFIGGQLKPLILLYDVKNDLMLPLSEQMINELKTQEMSSLGTSMDRSSLFEDNVDYNDMMSAPDYATRRYIKQASNNCLLNFLQKRASIKVKQSFLNLLGNKKSVLQFMLNNGYEWGQIKKACEVRIAPKKVTKKVPIRIKKDVNGLTHADKKNMLKFGFTVIDDRSSDSISQAYEIPENVIENPQFNGFFEMLTNQGLTNCFVGRAKLFVPEGYYPEKLSWKTVVVSKNGYYISVDKQDVYSQKKGSNFFSTNGTPIEAMNASPMDANEYIIWDPKTETVYDKMRVISKTKTQDGVIVFKCSFGCNDGLSVILKEDGKVSFFEPNNRVQNYDYSPYIEAYFPKRCVAFKLKSDDIGSEEKLSILPRLAIDSFLLSKYAKLENRRGYIYENGLPKEAHYGFEDFVKKAMLNYGLTLTGAEILYNRPLFVKRAFPMENTREPYVSNAFSAPPVEQMTTEKIYDVDTVNKSIEDLSQISEAVGDQAIFDHGSVAVLSQMENVSDEIGSYIPDIVKLIDRLGRLLFMLWTKSDVFSDKMGLTKLTLFENRLKDVFINLGKILIDIKQGTWEKKEEQF